MCPSAGIGATIWSNGRLLRHAMAGPDPKQAIAKESGRLNG